MTKRIPKRLLAHAMLGFIGGVFFSLFILGYVLIIGWLGTLIVFGGVVAILLLIAGAEWARNVLMRMD